MRDIPESVQQLLKDKAPQRTIQTEFNRHYKDDSDSRHVLLCCAVHYGHKDMVREMMETVYDKDCEIKPLIAAVASRDLEMLDMLLGLGVKDDAPGYGVITDGQLNKDNQYECYAMDIVMEQDDVEWMFRLSDVFHDEHYSVVHHALQNNAEKCLQALIDGNSINLSAENMFTYLLQTAAKSKLSLLKTIVE